MPQARDEGKEVAGWGAPSRTRRKRGTGSGGRQQTDQRSTVPMSAWDALMGDGRVIEAPDVSTT